MARPEVVEKMKATLKRIGHKPRERRGNGSDLTTPQRRLATFLGWQTEVTITMNDGQLPAKYTVDIAHPSRMVCVEVDGGSHCSRERQESDRRRDERLASLGWLTFRFWNLEAMEHTEECARMVWSTTSKWRPRTPTS